MRDEKGQFVKGERSHPETEFKRGQHWRSHKPYWDKDWLFEEYTIKGHSASDIARQEGCTENNILFWLHKHEIPCRSIREARSIKHWGESGSDNPNWQGGLIYLA